MSASPLTESKASPATSPILGTGTEWVIDAFGCDPKQLQDLPLVQSICDRVIRDLGLKVLGEPLSHRFGGAGGVTALYMLTASHLTCHTYPEYGMATFNLYCCRERPEWDWRGRLRECLGADRVEVRRLARGRAVETTASGREESFMATKPGEVT